MKVRMLVLLGPMLMMAVGSPAAQARGEPGIDPAGLRVRWGFGRSFVGVGSMFDPATLQLFFGGRGGFFLSREDPGGGGYGYLHFGSRGPIGGASCAGNLGLDLYAGVGVGGFGSESMGGGSFQTGPVLDAGLYLGASRSLEYGINLERLINILELASSPVTIGITIGGKSGRVVVDWEDRNLLGR